MKKFLFCIAGGILTPMFAYGASVNFSWLPNSNDGITDPAAITTGYKINYGPSAGNYTSFVDVGNPAPINGRVLGTVENVPDGTRTYFAATAYSVSDESDFSTELYYDAPEVTPPTEPIKAPVGFMITNISQN